MNCYQYYKAKCREYGFRYGERAVGDMLFYENFHFVNRDGEEIAEVKPIEIKELNWYDSSLAPYTKWVLIDQKNGKNGVYEMTFRERGRNDAANFVIQQSNR